MCYVLLPISTYDYSDSISAILAKPLSLSFAIGVVSIVIYIVGYLSSMTFNTSWTVIFSFYSFITIAGYTVSSIYLIQWRKHADDQIAYFYQYYGFENQIQTMQNYFDCCGSKAMENLTQHCPFVSPKETCTEAIEPLISSHMTGTMITTVIAAVLTLAHLLELLWQTFCFGSRQTNPGFIDLKAVFSY